MPNNINKDINFKISNNITENMNFQTAKTNAPQWDNKTGGRVMNFIDYLQDNSTSKKNKGRDLEVEFVSVDPKIKNSKDLKKYLLELGKELPTPKRYKDKRGFIRQDSPIKEVVSTLNLPEDSKNFKTIFNDWVKNEIKFLQDQKFSVLCCYVHFKESTPHAHFVLLNAKKHKFIYKNQKGTYERTRLIYGNDAMAGLDWKQSQAWLKEFHNKHYDHLTKWTKKYNLPMAEKGEETTLSGLRKGTNITRYVKVLTQITNMAIEKGDTENAQNVKKALKELKARGKKIDALELKNQDLQKQVNELLKPIKQKGKIKNAKVK